MNTDPKYLQQTSLLEASLLGLTLSALMIAPAHARVNDRPYFKANSIVIVFGADDFSNAGGEAPVVFDFLLLDNVSSGQAATDIIGLDGRTTNFNTGRFNPIESGETSGREFEISGATSGGDFISAGPHQTLDENDAFTAFGLDTRTNIDLLGRGNRASRFFVVSNVAFDIFGEAINLVTAGDFDNLDLSNINYRLRINTTGGAGENRWGGSAQDPSTGGAGIVLGQNGTPYSLDDLSSGPTKVFDGGRRTARTTGSIMQQAVSFQSRYRLQGAAIGGNNYDFSLGTGTIGAEVIYTVYTP